MDAQTQTRYFAHLGPPVSLHNSRYISEMVLAVLASGKVSASLHPRRRGVLLSFSLKHPTPRMTSRRMYASHFDADSTMHGNESHVTPKNRLQGSNNALPRPTTTPGTSTSATFNWQRQWYPVAPLSYLDTTKPTAITILGQNLAIWQGPGSKEWIAFSDACPHRRAPLSEGRIVKETSTLQCAYHGWSFDKSGACASIPQAGSTQLEDLAKASPRACAAQYPTTTAKGLLWVWMECAPGAEAHAAHSPVALPTELRGGGGSTTSGSTSSATGKGTASEGVLLGDWMMRDLPISWEYLVENLLDPSHIHYAHHGVIGTRGKGRGLKVVLVNSKIESTQPQTKKNDYSRGEGSALNKTTHVSTATSGHPFGFSFEIIGNELMKGRPSQTHFLPPALVWLEFPVPSLPGRNISQTKGSISSPPPSASMLFYAVPVSPGHSRIIAGYSTDALPTAINKVLQSQLMSPLLHMFQWAADLSAHEVLDGDTVLLRYQEEYMAGMDFGGDKDWKKDYFMPVAADAAVKEFRRWLEKEGARGPQYSRSFSGKSFSQNGYVDGKRDSSLGIEVSEQHLTHRQILDRYEQHTKFCPYCRPALRNVRVVRSVLNATTSASFAGGFALAALEAASSATIGLGSGSGVSRDPVQLGAALGLFAIGVGCGVVNRSLDSLEKRFTYRDYVHSKK